MDFMKVIDQTVREIKREVNLKVLKVPEIEQKDHDVGSSVSKSSAKQNDSKKYSSIPPHRLGGPSNNDDDDFDDFDPRGTSNNSMKASRFCQLDLFGQSLIGELFDAPAPCPVETSIVDNNNSSEVGLFAEATFVSASRQTDTGASSQTQKEVDLFASQPATTPSVPSTIDLFASPEPVVKQEVNLPKPDSTSATTVDPFASVPLNTFDGSDPFDSFTSHSKAVSMETAQNTVSDGNTNNLTGNGKASADSKAPIKMAPFQVKAGIWADSLSRGLIDLNITAPKKVSLADVGVVGGLSDGSDERDKGPLASFYMGRSMGVGSGLGRTGFTTSQQPSGGFDDLFSNLGGQQHQFGSFQK